MARRTRPNTISTYGRHASGPQVGASRRPRQHASSRGNVKATADRPRAHAPKRERGRESSRHGTVGRRSASTLIEEVRRKKRRKHIAVGIVVGIIIVACAIAVGIHTYFTHTNAQLDLAPSNATEALVAETEGDATYILCSAELGISKSAPVSYAIPNHTRGFMLVRLDTQTKQMTFITIPADTLVRFSDGQYRPLIDALDVGGEAEVVSRVAEFCGVKINHYISTTADGIASMVDAVGGVTMALATDIDDPFAGTTVLLAGDTTLDGSDALQLLRAQNVPGGLEGAASLRVDFTCALLTRAFTAEGLDLAALISDASHYIDTDLSATDLMALSDALRPFDEISVYSCIVPGSSTTNDEGITSYDPKMKAWNELIALVREGQPPGAVDSSVRDIDPSAITVEVRNGTLTNGAAAQMASILTDAGFKVTDVGNTNDDTIYPETLVVYTSPEYEGAAKAIIAAQGGGRVVNGGDFYHSQANVISIVGSDWTPAY